MKINSMLLTDFYKTIHHLAYVEGLETLVSYWTPRMSREEKVDKVVMFGLQAAIKKYLIEEFTENFFSRDKEEVVKEYKRIIANTMTEQAANTEFLEGLHDLGYLPIQIKAVEEGTRVNIKTPMIEFSNTVKGYGWLVNYLETLLSCNLWMPITSATKAYMYRETVNEYYDKTVDEGERERHTAVGDFSMRGMGAVESAMSSGAAHLTSFTGTATIPAIVWLEEYYNTDCEKEVVGRGTPSTEHSVMSSYGRDGEFDSYKRLITEVFPKGNLSIVSDTYDYWNVLINYLPKLREDILNRDGKIIIRGDSGNPVDIICGVAKTRNNVLETLRDFEALKHSRSVMPPEVFVKEDNNFYRWVGPYGTDWVCYGSEASPEWKGTVEVLWDIFGGHINSKGYKVLDKHIGAIYGDSITPERAKLIFKELEEKGFSASNVTLGAGSYSYQYSTRDVYGFALKATNSVINGVETQIYKEPKTDTGNFKKSQRGMCYVYQGVKQNIHGNDKMLKIENTKTDDILYLDGLEMSIVNSMENNLLVEVFKDGKLIKDMSLKEIRDKLHNNKF